MKNPNNRSPPNTTSDIVELYNEDSLDITQDTEFKRIIISMIKEINKFKECPNKQKN